MCFDSDLFGDVIVTIKDIDLWLDVIANMRGVAQSRREHYAKFSDVANKIKLSKLNGSFEKLINEYDANSKYSQQPIKLFNTKYVTAPAELLNQTECPAFFHVCHNHLCHVFIKRTKHEKQRAAYAKRKGKH